MVFYGLQSASQFLYHYTRADTAVSKILPNRTIRLSSYINTNDPKEAKDWIFGLGTRESLGGVSDDKFKDIETQATAIAKNACKLLCLTTDDEEAVGFDPNCIWSRGYCRPPMWAQYAAKHTGVCLIFDRAFLQKAMDSVGDGDGREVHSGLVQYRNRAIVRSLRHHPYILDFDMVRQSGLAEAVAQQVTAHRSELFFEKAKDWEHEREYRWVVWGEQGTELLIDYGPALRAVVVGADFDESLGPIVWQSCRDHSSELGQIGWKNGVPEIVPRIWP